MFIAYEIATTRILKTRNGNYGFETAAAAKAAITRAGLQATHAVLPADEFRKIEKTETKRTIYGKEFTQSVNTPACCDPSTETYWSM
jgi:hypothetical protein